MPAPPVDLPARLAGAVDVAVPGATACDVRPLAGGVADRTWRVDTVVDGQPGPSVVVRAPAPYDDDGSILADEWRTTRFVADRGLPVPRPLVFDDGDPPLLVLEYVDGSWLRDEGDGAVAGPAFARLLAAIHAVGGDDPGLEHLPRRAPYIEGHLDDPPAVLDTSVEEPMVREALRRSRPLPEPGGPVLLHGDLWPGNVLWRNGDPVAVIDWEDCSVGTPLADLAVTRLDLTWAFGRPVAEAATDEYARLTGLDLAGEHAHALAVWDLVAALRPAGAVSLWARAWPAAGRPDITPATMRDDLRRSVADALARLDA